MNSHFYNRLMIGFILVGIGVLFLLEQMGILRDISLGQIFSTYWPVIIIVFSLKGIFFEKRLRYGWIGSYFWNLISLCIGVYFLAFNLGYIHFSFRELIRFMLPVALILFGISMLFRPSGSRHSCKTRRQIDEDKNASMQPPPPPPVDDIDWTGSSVLDSKFPIDKDPLDSANKNKNKNSDWDGVSSNRSEDWKEVKKEQKQYWKEQKQNWKDQKQDWKEQKNGHHWNQHNHGWHDDGSNYDKRDVEYRSGFIGDMYLGQDAWELKPMNISHFIGDTKIDLTRASIPYGETRLQISAFIGDVSILVPDDMDLQVRVTTSVFIGELNVLDRHESGFARSMVSESSHYKEAEKKLRVDVSLFLGDVIVKKVG